MIYHLNLVFNGQRKTVILEHTLQEYGISEQTFWSCWIAGRRHINGDGDTLEAAVNDMIKTVDYNEEMYHMAVRIQMNLSTQGSVDIRCPVIG